MTFIIRSKDEVDYIPTYKQVASGKMYITFQSADEAFAYLDNTLWEPNRSTHGVFKVGISLEKVDPPFNPSGWIVFYEDSYGLDTSNLFPTRVDAKEWAAENCLDGKWKVFEVK